MDEGERTEDEEDKSVDDEEHKEKPLGPVYPNQKVPKAEPAPPVPPPEHLLLAYKLRAALMAKVQALEMKHALDMQ